MSEQEDVLNRFLGDLHQEVCQFKIPMDVVSDIKEAVEELVHSLTAEIVKIDPLFAVSKVLKRGSFYEGTRVRLPDEFDFLVILEEISKPGAVAIETICKENPGSVHVITTHPELLQFAIDKGKRDSGVVIYSRNPGSSILQYKISRRFKKLMFEASMKLFPESISAKFSHKITTPSGHLLFNITNMRSYTGPNAYLELQWIAKEVSDFQEFPITVDVSPAISYQSSVTTADGHPDTRQLFAIPGLSPAKSNCKLELCWRVSYSDAEFAKMEAMSETLKRCYRLLKYMCRGGGAVSYSLKSLNSFMLKMAIFHHADECLKEQSLRFHLVSTLRLLYRRAEEGFLPHYFIPDKNMWTRNGRKEMVTPKKIVHDMMVRLERIASIHPDDYVFEDKFRRFWEYFGQMEAEAFAYGPRDPFSGYNPIDHAKFLESL